MMRLAFIGFACAALAACATSEVRPVRYDYPLINDLKVEIGELRETDAGGIEALLKLENIGSRQICVSKDTVSNPMSFGTQFYARDRDGVLLPHEHFDLMPLPVEGQVTLPANVPVAISYNVSDRFPTLADREFVMRNRPIEFLAVVMLSECAKRNPALAQSGWQEVSIPILDSNQ